MKIKQVLAVLVTLVIASTSLFADIARDANGKPKNDNTVQRAARGVFDLQKNTVSNLEFYTTNYGIFGLDVGLNQGSGKWPRGSSNHYIFGGGIWFAAQKQRPGQDDPNVTRNYVVVSYNPNSGGSWMVPGRISDGLPVDNNLLTKYRTYFSPDFSPSDGKPIETADGPSWPIWDASPRSTDTLKNNRYFGYYIQDETQRSKDIYPKGPAFISGEDIFSTFKDTDLSRYEGGIAQRRTEGYPLMLQFENMIYSWGFGDYQDIIFLAYNITNESDKALRNCWMAPVLDIDIASAFNPSFGAGNDRVKFYDTDTTLNMAFQWTDADRGERGQGFGYLGFNFLESPAVQRFYDTIGWNRILNINTPDPDDSIDVPILAERIVEGETNFLRKDSAFYANSSQLGLVTFRNWSIAYDPKEDDERFNFISAGIREGDTGPGDKRFMMATGPFNMRPKDTTRVVIGLILANASKGSDADGTEEDIADLVRKTKFAQEVYDNNFRAPQPPYRARIMNVKELNHAVSISWDETSEQSVDLYERGLDFMGYRLYRARRPDLMYSEGTNNEEGPYGWKLIAGWDMPLPFQKSVHYGGGNEDMSQIDSLRIIGPLTDAAGNVLDSMAIRIMRVPQGCNLYPISFIQTGLALDPTFRADNPKYVVPIIANFDTSFYSQPWGPYYKSMAKFTKQVQLVNSTTQELITYPYMNYKPGQNNEFFDKVAGGVAYINRALMKFNPLLYQRKTINIDQNWFKSLPTDGLVYRKIDTLTTQTVDTAFIMSSYRQVYVDNLPIYTIDAYVPYPKNLWMTDTTQVTHSLNYLYELIKQGSITLDIPDWEGSEEARNNVITPYMARVTNNRTFVDIGDDNRDGTITYDEDAQKTEKLINNVPYYYLLLSSDEGDYGQPTPPKINDGSIDAFGRGLVNTLSAIPRAQRAQRESAFEVIHVDPNIGGLYNFNFFAIDPQRVAQLFGGDTLELEFNPTWEEREISFLGRGENSINKFGLYRRNMRITNLSKGGMELFNGNSYFEVQPCFVESYRELFTENAFSYVLSDTLVYDNISGDSITFGIPTSREIRERTGKFYSGDFKERGFCYTPAMRPPAYGTFGFEFDFTIKQFGGDYRADETTIAEAKLAGSQATTPINFASSPNRDPEVVYVTQPVTTNFLLQTYSTLFPNQVDGSFNNGPGHYLVEFLPGGEEIMDVEWGADGSKVHKEFRVPYLTMKVVNQISYDRPAPEVGEDATTKVAYTGEMPFMYLDTAPAYSLTNTFTRPARYYPDPRNLSYHGIATDEFIGKYNIAAYGWVNSRYSTNVQVPQRFARPFNSVLRDKQQTYLGQGKYYLTGYSIDGKDTLDFTHTMNIAGVNFALDYANRGGRFPNVTEWTRIPRAEYTFGPDFKAGEKIMLKTFGGALGYPMPGAKVRVKVSKPFEEGEKYTDKLLDQIQVVPNPYYISHAGQRSPYNAMLYFTRLPEVCKIEIYTITGDLVATINHDELTSGSKDRAALSIWSLLTSNGQRIASQTLAAVITTPDGAQTIKNFSVIVGGFTILTD